jgi:hypothetical protein
MKIDMKVTKKKKWRRGTVVAKAVVELKDSRFVSRRVHIGMLRFSIHFATIASL